LRWRIAALVSTAIVLSYMDRQTLPWTLSQIKEQHPFSDQIKALFNSAFLIAYGLMYLGGGWLPKNGCIDLDENTPDLGLTVDEKALKKFHITE
jgi:hypothetical protein